MTVFDGEDASALSTFSALCAEKNLLNRPDGLGEEDVLDGLTDEGALLRYLQANRMNPNKALEQLIQANKILDENDAIRLYGTISEEDFEDTRRQYPHWTGRRDRNGRPIIMFDIAALDKDGMAHWRETRAKDPNMTQRALTYYSHFTRFVLPLCSAAKGSPVTSCVYVVDVSSLSMKQAWDVREFARDVSWILQTCFPETIHRVYACNAPSFLARIWSFLKGFIDPVTATKIQFLTGDETYKVLSEDINHDNLPVHVGGAFEFETGMLPRLDAETRAALDWTGPEELPGGALKWIQNESGERTAVATGGNRRAEIARLK